VGEAVGGAGAAADRYQASQNELLQKQYELQTQRQTAESEAALRKSQQTYYELTGEARKQIANVRAMNPQDRGTALLVAHADKLRAFITQFEQLGDMSNPDQVQEYQEAKLQLAEINPLITETAKAELAKLKGPGGAGAAPGAAPGEAPGAAAPGLSSASADDILSQARARITSNHDQKQAVIDIIKKQRPDINTKSLEDM
jgi:hypothetical protein